jgi:CRP/FNR family transcriptional regulator, anaerobic regulatory protein
MPAALTSAQFPFLSGLGTKARQELSALPLLRVTGHAPLLRRADPANGVYLVAGGLLRVYYISPDGREATLYRVQAGGTCVLALTATLSAEPYPAWVQAGPSGATFVRVPGELFHQLFQEEPPFRAFVFQALSGRVFELMLALEEAGSVRVEQRVARYLLRAQAADGTVRITQTGLASELGTAREVVFRALRALAERGLLATGRGRIRVLDAAGLALAAGMAAPAPLRPLLSAPE